MRRRRLLRLPAMLCGGYLLVCVLVTLAWGPGPAALEAVSAPSALVLGCWAVLYVLAREQRAGVAS